MAKRKRLNKPLFITLVSVAAVCFGLTVFLGWRYRGQLIPKLFPKDPVKHEALGDKALKEEDYEAAEKNYYIAAKFSEPSEEVRRYYKIAKFQFEWWKDPVGLSESERRERLRSSLSYLQKIIQRDPEHKEALHLLCEINWGLAQRYLIPGFQGRHEWERYTENAEKLAAVDKEDHLTRFRLGLAYESMARTNPVHADKAEKSFLEAAKIKPDESKYWIVVARFYVRTRRRPEQAKATFEEAIKTIPNSAELRVNYASFLRTRMRDKDNADKQVREAIRAEPENPIGNLYLAQYYIQDGEPEKAIEQLQSAKQLEPGDFRIYSFLAVAHNRKKQPEQAAGALREGVEAIAQKLTEQTDPSPREQRILEVNKVRLLGTLTDTLLDMIDEDHEQKEQFLEEARRYRDEISSLLTKLDVEGSAVREQRLSGRIAHAEGDLRLARELLEKAYKTLKTSDSKTATALVRVYTKLGLHGLAERIVDDFVDLPGNVDLPQLLTYKAQYEMKRRNYEQARLYLTRALRADPENEDILKLKVRCKIDEALNHARQLSVEGHPDEAMKQLEQLYQEYPDVQRVRSSLLSFCLSAGQRDKAKLLIEQALKRDPDDELMKRYQAMLEQPADKQFEIWMEEIEEIEDPLQRALEKADASRIARKQDLRLKYLKEAAEINPTDSRVVRGMIEYALMKKDWKLGREWIAKVKEIDPDGVDGQIYAARLAMARKEYSSAVVALNEVLKKRPEMKFCRSLLGDCYLRINDLGKAEEVFRTLTKNDPGFPLGVVGMARVMELLGRRIEHADWVERAYRLVPQHPYVREAHLGLQEEKADPEKIIRQREEILERDPTNLPNCRRLARLYHRTGRLGKAEEMYQFLYRTEEDSVRGVRMLADFYARTDRFSDATKVFASLIDAAATSEQKVAVWMEYGQFLSSYDPTRAEAAFQRAIKEGPEVPQPYLEMARFLARQNRSKDAVKFLRKYNGLSPSDIYAEKRLIRYLVEAGEADLAAQRLDRILDKDRTDVEALVIKAVLVMNRDDLDEAEELLNRAIRLKPKYHEALLRRSRLYLRKGQISRAEEDLRTLSEELGTADIGVRLGMFYNTIGDPIRAERAFREVLGKQHDHSGAIEGLIGVYFRQKNWSRLERELAEAKKIFPNQGRYLLLEGRMWEQRGDKGRAVSSYAKAAELDPSARIDSTSPSALRLYWEALVDTKQYERVLSLSEGYEERPDYGAWVKPIRARALARTQKIPEADALFISALKGTSQVEELAFILEQVGKAYGLKKGREKWAGWIEKHRPDGSLARVALATHYVGSRAFSEAERQLVKALDKARTPDEKYWVHKQLGAVCYAAGKLRQAEKAYMEALVVRPDDPVATNNLAYIYADDLNQPQKALELIERVIKRASSNPSVLDTYGWTLGKLERYKEAEAQLRLAVQMMESLPLSQVIESLPASMHHLGWVYEKTNRLREAEKWYERAQELMRDSKDNPQYRQLEEALQRVRKKLGRRTGNER